MKYINQVVQYVKGKIDSSNIVKEVVKDLQEIVGYKNIVLAPAVSPGTSLQALQKEYERMGKELNGKYKQEYIDQAVAQINDSLERNLWE